jgi:hypothetical protein
MFDAILALPALRSPTEARGEVKALAWDGINPESMWAAVKPWWSMYRITLRADRRKQLRLEMLGDRNEDLGDFADWDQAKAAAQADFETRMSTLYHPPAREAVDDAMVERAARALAEVNNEKWAWNIYVDRARKALLAALQVKPPKAARVTVPLSEPDIDRMLTVETDLDGGSW